MNWPIQRINFDSEISRLDLIGRETLTTDPDTKTTISRFVDGILPQAVAGPYILLCDEIDFVRPDIAYVMQRALEGNGIMITEDSGRFIPPHSMSRIVATANTIGQGDASGIYEGARNQSMAMLDRFTIWLKQDYLADNVKEQLLKEKFPELPEEYRDIVLGYVIDHENAFKEKRIRQPITPRGMLELARLMSWHLELYNEQQRREIISETFETVVFNRHTDQERDVIVELSKRFYN